MADARQGRSLGRFLSTLLSRAAIVLVVLALVVGAYVAAWVPRHFSDPARLSRLVADALPELQADISFAAAQVGWRGPIVLEGIRVVPRDGSRPPFTVQRIEVSRGLIGMLLSGGDLGRLRVTGLVADVVFDAERESNLTKLFAEQGGGAAAPVPAPAARRRRSPVSLRLEVVDAVVRISGPWTADPWVSDPIDIAAALGPAPGGASSQWTVDPVQLLTHARLEPPVAKSVLAYIAPVLADATRTGGEFSLRLDGAVLPVGDPGSGTVAGVLSMHAVDLGPGPLAIKTIQELPLRLPPPPTVRIADQSHIHFRLADRRVFHTGLEFGLPLKQPGQRLDIQSSGSVGIDDDSIDLKFVLPIPADLPQDRPLIAALAGKKISVGVVGSLGDPRVVFDGSIRQADGEIAADVIDRLRNRDAGATQPPPGPRGPKPAEPPPPPAPSVQTDAAPAEAAAEKSTAGKIEDIKSRLPAEVRQDPTADAVIDLVGGVLEEVARRRAAREAEAAANPGQAPPPRRGGLLRRETPAAPPQK